MERVASTITIGIRELFRVLVPGLMIAAYIRAEFPHLLVPWNGSASFGYILILSFFAGLFLYVLQLHRLLQPWSSEFHKQLARLDQEIRIALGGAPPLVTEDDYNAEYKHFLETRVDRSFTERIHYFTSFYYLLAEISQLFFVFAIVELVFVILVIFSPLHLLWAFLFIVGFIIFYRFARLQFKQTVDEQVMMIKIKHAEFASMQRSLELEDILKTLKNVCYKMLDEIVLDPDKRNYRIDCQRLSTKDWRTKYETDLYIVKIYTSYPRTIGGDPGGYKGFYKERVEAVLNHIVSLYQTGERSTKVSLEVIPEQVREDILESLVPINKAYKGIIEKGSPIHEIIKKFKLQHVLVRGRHLVGPNPGLIHVVESICQRKIPKSALDLFAGTGVVSRFLHDQGVSNIICVDSGTHFKTCEGMFAELPGITCVIDDAFHFHISKPFDLILADPYYEDALNFLNTRIQEIRSNASIFVFVCAGVEHERQREECKKVLLSNFKEVDEQLLYGQSILVCRYPK